MIPLPCPLDPSLEPSPVTSHGRPWSSRSSPSSRLPAPHHARRRGDAHCSQPCTAPPLAAPPSPLASSSCPPLSMADDGLCTGYGPPLQDKSTANKKRQKK